MKLNSSTIILDSTPYQVLGKGDEGIILNYQDLYAIKLFTKYDRLSKKLERKLQKLEQLILLKDVGATFPLGFVSSNGKEVDGYYTRLVQGKSFQDLKGNNILLRKGDEVLQRLHKKNIALGDIKEDNILIEDKQPIFIDTDNWKYNEYLFDLIPERASFLYELFGGPLSFQDNDILLYSLMCLKIITQDERFKYPSSKEDILKALKELHLDQETKEILSTIFSDSINKPYIGPVLEKIKRK